MFQADPTTAPWPLRAGCVVDLARRRVTVDGDAVSLTTREAELLAYLVQREGTDVSTEALQTEVWGHAPDVISRAVPNAVHRLKKKIEPDPANPRHLITVHGVGFRLVRDTDVEAVPVDAELPGTFGRADDRARVRALLRDHRLVTLSGLGGIGKTHLATAVQRALGGLFVDLSGATDEAGVLRAVAAALGLTAADDPLQQVGRALAARGEVLVVVDNAEQVVDPLREALSTWLDRAPRTRWLVTSRVRLGLSGEQVVPLGPLAVPEPDAAADALRTNPGVQLFLTRAVGDPGTLDEVAALVRALEGIPLAIELAAARTAVVDAAGILARLSDRLAVLRRPGAERHDAVTTTLQWSWSLLSEVERTALAQLSVFRAPFRLEAAEAVVAMPDDVFALDVVQALVEASLVQRVPDARPARLRLFAVVRAFAARRLDDHEVVHDRHAGFFAAHGGPGVDLSNRNPEADALARLRDAELEDLVAAMDHALDAGRAPAALDLARALTAAFEFRGPRLAARRPVEAALALAADVPGLCDRRVALRLEWGSLLGKAARWDEVAEVVAAARADAPGSLHRIQLHFLDTLRLFFQARPDQAAASWQAAMDGRPEGGLRAQLLTLGAHLALRRGQTAEATSLLGQAMALCGDNVRLRRNVHTTLGTALRHIGDLQGALHHKEEALRLARQTGSLHAIADALEGLAISQALPEAAERTLHEAAELHARLGRPRATVLGNLAELALDRRDPTAAHALATRAVDIAEEGGAAIVAAMIRAIAGRALLDAGETAAALPVLDRARRELPATEVRARAQLDLARAVALARTGDTSASAVVDAAAAHLRAPADPIHLAVIRGEVARALGDAEAARRWLDEAEALAAETAPGRVERLLEDLRAHLSGAPEG